MEKYIGLFIRLPEELLTTLREEARDQERSVAAQLRAILNERYR